MWIETNQLSLLEAFVGALKQIEHSSKSNKLSPTQSEHEESPIMIDRDACAQLLERLHRRESVTAHEVKRAVGNQHWNDYLEFRGLARKLRAEAKIASRRLRLYVNILRIADLRDAQAERMRVRTGKSMARGKSPCDLYERALGMLAELMLEDPSQFEYLDRPFSPIHYDTGADKESVPRLWFHTQNARNPGERAVKTVRQLKIEALERAIEEC